MTEYTVKAYQDTAIEYSEIDGDLPETDETATFDTLIEAMGYVKNWLPIEADVQYRTLGSNGLGFYEPGQPWDIILISGDEIEPEESVVEYDDSDAYSTKGHLTVQRPLNEATANLVEVWELENLIWVDENVGEYDIVKLHVCDVNEPDGTGIPRSDYVTETCSWDDVPAEVQNEFIAQIERLNDAIGELSHE